jgi:hypothetical protein
MLARRSLVEGGSERVGEFEGAIHSESERTSGASEPRERSGDSGAPASERVGEFEGR